MGRLDKLDLSLELSHKEEGERLQGAYLRLLSLRLALGMLTGQKALGPPVCILLEGWDASGKGGAIQRLVSPLDPRHVRVVQFAAPSSDDKRHHFLRRFWPAMPGWGGMSILDRSWYGRVLVERVEGLATLEQWTRAYTEIVDFEKSLAEEGMILIKFWLHISAKEQLRRFTERQTNSLKSWKLTDDDWRNRKKRKQYAIAVEEMLERTDHPMARWHLVEAENKGFARVKVVETVCSEIELGMAAHQFKIPALPATRERRGR